MKQFKPIFVTILLSVFLASCSASKPKTTNNTVSSESQNMTSNNSASETENSASDTKTTKDGSSTKNAFKVKSIAEEYQIAKKLCPNCTMNGQALISEGNKHYDVLKLTNEKGEKVDYYFDINSFYGKW